jgi:hypothetical protein
VNEAGDALLAGSTFARDEHGGVDRRDPTGELDERAHGQAQGHQALDGRGCQWEQQPRRGDGCLGVDQPRRAVRGFGREGLVAERPARRGLPRIQRTDREVALRVPAGDAAHLDGDGSALRQPGQRAREQAAHHPTTGGRREAQVRDVLLGFPARLERDARRTEEVIVRSDPIEAMQPVQACDGGRVRHGWQVVGHARAPPPRRVAELQEHRARLRDAHLLEERLAE